MFVVARWYFIRFNNMLVFSDPEPPIIKTPQVWVGIPDQFGLWFISTDRNFSSLL